MPLERIKLSFADGLIFSRMELLFDRKVPAASVFSGAYYFLEQLGFRKIIDSTFMMASIIIGNPDPEGIGRYFRALRRAQRDIDLRPELYTHYYRKEFPEHFHDIMDTALGARRAHRLRALHEGHVRGVVPVDRRA